MRNYASNKALDTEKVKHCIRLATLAPSSSNMQLWEFFHITNPDTLKALSVACLNQSATSTANQVVVVVARQDLYKKRTKQVIGFERGNIERNSPEERQKKRIKDREIYYERLIPFLYGRFFGILGAFRKALTWSISLFRPMTSAVSENDMRIVIHKSCGLAAQTFMIAMANEGYDTCPLEGFDSRRVKKILKVPHRAEINMVISCGIRNGNKGIWGERFRVPFEEVYKHV
ncbi:MAG: nitroreductase family protein [Paludibacteraceae bacterium]